MDAATVSLAGEPRELQGLMFNLIARMHMPTGFDPGRDQSAMAYRPMKIGRVTKYEFLSGRPVFLLRSPEGITWVMQTFTDHIHHGLRESDLPDLAPRLALPDGWQYKAVTIGQDLTITTSGVGEHRPGPPGQHVPRLRGRRKQLRPLGSRASPGVNGASWHPRLCPLLGPGWWGG